jgi:hypothetical protein
MPISKGKEIANDVKYNQFPIIPQGLKSENLISNDASPSNLPIKSYEYLLSTVSDL